MKTSMAHTLWRRGAPDVGLDTSATVGGAGSNPDWQEYQFEKLRLLAHEVKFTLRSPAEVIQSRIGNIHKRVEKDYPPCRK